MSITTPGGPIVATGTWVGPGAGTQTAGGPSGMKYMSGFPYGPSGGNATDSTRPLNQLTLVPVRVDRPITINGFASRVSSAAAGALMRYGMYADVANRGMPDTLLMDAGTIDASTTGLKTLPCLPFSVTPGWYYLAAVNQGNAVGACPCIVTPALLDGVPKHQNINAGTGWTLVGVSGAMPPVLTPFSTGGVTDTVWYLAFLVQ